LVKLSARGIRPPLPTNARIGDRLKNLPAYEGIKKTALLLFPWVGESAIEGRTPRRA
jgi:hypothetical protein